MEVDSTHKMVIGRFKLEHDLSVGGDSVVLIRDRGWGRVSIWVILRVESLGLHTS